MTEMYVVESSSIDAIGYDESARQLHVVFSSSGNRYIYFDVDKFVFQAFLRADSKGRYFNKAVKGIYSYRRS